jgi:hypothetical protein
MSVDTDKMHALAESSMSDLDVKRQQKHAMALIHKAEEALSQLGAQVVFTPMAKRIVKMRKELNAIKKDVLGYKDEN